MPKKAAKFISEYLIPSLNNQRFGDHLRWIDKNKSIFHLDWCHKSGTLWTEGEAEVFVEWDKLKGHYQPEDKQYYTKSKQRFRSLLYKLTTEKQIMEIKNEEKFTKVYRILGVKKPKKRKGHLIDLNSDYSFINEMLPEESRECIDEISGMEVSNDNHIINGLEDHTYCSYSKLSDTDSGSEKNQINTEDLIDFTISTQFELSDKMEKKVLVERNYPYDAVTNIPISYDMSNSVEILPNMLIDDALLTGTKSATSTKIAGRSQEDISYDLGSLIKYYFDENKIPLEAVDVNFPIYSYSTELYDSLLPF